MQMGPEKGIGKRIAFIADDAKRTLLDIDSVLAQVCPPGEIGGTEPLDPDRVAAYLEALLGQPQDLHVVQNGERIFAYIESVADREAVRQYLGGGGLSEAVPVDGWQAVVENLLKGEMVWVQADPPKAFVLPASLPPMRSIDRPQTEISTKGSQEAFADALHLQIGQLRRRLPHPALRIRQMEVGAPMGTRIAICFLQGIAHPRYVAEVEKRLAPLRNKHLLSSWQLGGLMSDQPGSPFPQVRSSERVDQMVFELVNGKVVVLVDGTTFPIAVPAVFLDFYRTYMDYVYGVWATGLARITRFVGLLIGLYLPALYIALLSVTPGVFPVFFFLVATGDRATVPISPTMEVVFMFAVIALLQEAALRLPKAMGGTLGTVGAIVVGTAMVKAGVVSSLMIVTITLTALGAYTSPLLEMSNAWRILSWPLIIAAYLLGIYGVVLVTFAIAVHLVSLSSLGVPYMAPMAPVDRRGLRDSVIRLSLQRLKRPGYVLSPRDRK